MQIDYDILIAYGGMAKKIKKGDILFWEGNIPRFCYQVMEEGKIRIIDHKIYY